MNKTGVFKGVAVTLVCLASILFAGYVLVGDSQICLCEYYLPCVCNSGCHCDHCGCCKQQHDVCKFGCGKTNCGPDCDCGCEGCPDGHCAPGCKH